MTELNSDYSVQCSLTHTEPRGSKMRPIGLLYDTLIDAEQKVILTKIALSEAGDHWGIYQKLEDSGELALDRPTKSKLFLPVHSTDGATHDYFIGSWLEKGPEHKAFPSRGVLLPAMEHNPDQEIEFAAEMGARALLLATRDFYRLGGSHELLWASQEIAAVPEQNIIRD